jgi:hypothetical protein
MNSFDMFMQVEDMYSEDEESALREYLKELTIEDANKVVADTVTAINAIRTQKRSLDSWHQYITYRYKNILTQDNKAVLRIVFNINSSEEFFLLIIRNLF